MTKGIQWIILSGVSMLYALFGFGSDFGLENTLNTSALAVITFTLTIFIYRIYYLKDTSIESGFFSIDRVRSIRFSTIYFLILLFSISITLILSPFLISAILTVIMFILLLLLNIFIGVIFLVLLIFGGSIQFVDFGFSLVTFQFMINLFNNFNLTQTGILVVLILMLIISLTLTSLVIGRYVEDSSTNFAITVFHNLLFLSYIIGYRLMRISQYWSNGNITLNEASQVLKVGFIIYPFVCYFLLNFFFTRKENDDEYELPEVGKYVKFLLNFLTLIGIILLTLGLIGTVIDSFFLAPDQNSINSISILGTLMFVPIQLSAILFFFWMKIGDFTVDIRIDEIEYREELLRKAKEFKELE